MERSQQRTMEERHHMMVSSTQSTDALLAEYLRLINAKDAEIHRLEAELERAEMEKKRKQDNYQLKLRQMRANFEAFQRTAEAAGRESETSAREVERLREENATLVADVATLRGSVARQEEQLGALQRAADKAQRHESHARERIEHEMGVTKKALDYKLQEAAEKCAVLEEKLRAANERIATAEREAMRWKVEAQRFQHDHTEAKAAVKELKKKERDRVAREEVAAEVEHLELRHKTIVGNLEADARRLREELKEETARSAGVERQAVELRHTVDALEKANAAIDRQMREYEVQVTQGNLAHVQTLDEVKAEHSADVRALKEQVERLLEERGKAQKDADALAHRLREAERAGADAFQRFREDEAKLHQDLHLTRQRVRDLELDLESAKRIAAQQDSFAAAQQAKLEALREEFVTETGRLKGELEHADGTISRHVATTTHFETVVAELRDQTASLTRELNAERSATVRKEQEWRGKMLELESEFRIKEEERRVQIAHVEDTSRLKLSEQEIAMQQQQRDNKQKVAQLNAEIGHLQDQLKSTQQRANAILAERDDLHGQLQSKIDAERAHVQRIKELDEKVSKLGVEVMERDAAISTLRRSVESNTHSFLELEKKLESTRMMLDEKVHTVQKLESRCAGLATQLSTKEEEIKSVAATARRIEAAAAQHDEDMAGQLKSMGEKVQQLVAQLQGSEQQVNHLRNQMRQEAEQHADECATINREVLGPLQEKVESLVAANQRLRREVTEKDDQLADHTKLRAQCAAHQETIAAQQSDINIRDRKVKGLEEELFGLRDQVAALKRSQREAAEEAETKRKVQLDNEALMRRVQSLEEQLNAAQAHVNQMRSKDSSLGNEVSSYRSQLAVMQEKLANAESIKNITEAKLSEAQRRERELAAQLADMKSSEQMMQVVFKKQQEQIEIGNRMREQDLRRQQGGGGGGGEATPPPPAYSGQQRF